MIDENCYAISMSLNPHHHAAGDLLLTFEMNDFPIYESPSPLSREAR